VVLRTEDRPTRPLIASPEKIEEIKDTYVGPRHPYCYIVASNILREWLRTRGKASPPPPSPHENNEELELRTRAWMMYDVAIAENQEIVRQYYQQEKRAKIERRNTPGSPVWDHAKCFANQSFPHSRLASGMCASLHEPAIGLK